MTDFEKMVEMFERAGMTFRKKRNLNGTSYITLGEEKEFFFDENGALMNV